MKSALSSSPSSKEPNESELNVDGCYSPSLNVLYKHDSFIEDIENPGPVQREPFTRPTSIRPNEKEDCEPVFDQYGNINVNKSSAAAPQSRVARLAAMYENKCAKMNDRRSSFNRLERTLVRTISKHDDTDGGTHFNERQQMAENENSCCGDVKETRHEANLVLRDGRTLHLIETESGIIEVKSSEAGHADIPKIVAVLGKNKVTDVHIVEDNSDGTINTDFVHIGQDDEYCEEKIESLVVDSSKISDMNFKDKPDSDVLNENSGSCDMGKASHRLDQADKVHLHDIVDGSDLSVSGDSAIEKLYMQAVETLDYSQCNRNSSTTVGFENLRQSSLYSCERDSVGNPSIASSEFSTSSGANMSSMAKLYNQALRTLDYTVRDSSSKERAKMDMEAVKKMEEKVNLQARLRESDCAPTASANKNIQESSWNVNIEMEMEPTAVSSGEENSLDNTLCCASNLKEPEVEGLDNHEDALNVHGKVFEESEKAIPEDVNNCIEKDSDVGVGNGSDGISHSLDAAHNSAAFNLREPENGGVLGNHDDVVIADIPDNENLLPDNCVSKDPGLDNDNICDSEDNAVLLEEHTNHKDQTLKIVEKSICTAKGNSSELPVAMLSHQKSFKNVLQHISNPSNAVRQCKTAKSRNNDSEVDMSRITKEDHNESLINENSIKESGLEAQEYSKQTTRTNVNDHHKSFRDVLRKMSFNHISKQACNDESVGSSRASVRRIVEDSLRRSGSSVESGGASFQLLRETVSSKSSLMQSIMQSRLLTDLDDIERESSTWSSDDDI